MISLDKAYDITAFAAMPLYFSWNGCGDVQVQEFYIQFSNDPTCVLYTDPVDSNKWFGVDLTDRDYAGDRKWSIYYYRQQCDRYHLR